MAWYRHDGSRGDFRTGNRGDAIVKINNPAVGNVLASTDPLAIDIGDAAIAGALGEVSDSGHQHAAVATQFLRLLGEELTEGSSTSISAVDLVTITGLTIPVTQPLWIMGNWRKTAGATGVVSFGLKVNATVVAERATNSRGLASSTNTDQAENGSFVIYLGPRIANYLRPGARFTGASADSLADDAWQMQTADVPLVEITDIIIRGDGADVLQTYAVSNVRIYGLPTT